MSKYLTATKLRWAGALAVASGLLLTSMLPAGAASNIPFDTQPLPASVAKKALDYGQFGIQRNSVNFNARSLYTRSYYDPEPEIRLLELGIKANQFAKRCSNDAIRSVAIELAETGKTEPFSNRAPIDPSYYQDPRISFACKITKIHDGDTFWCRDTRDNKDIKVRLYGVDTPETKQGDYGKFSTNRFKDLVNGFSTVYVQSHGYDRYNRLLGTVYYNGINVNLYLVAIGAAFPYDGLLKGSCAYANYALAKIDAQANGAGFWAAGYNQGLINPKDFRRKK